MIRSMAFVTAAAAVLSPSTADAFDGDAACAGEALAVGLVPASVDPLSVARVDVETTAAGAWRVQANDNALVGPGPVRERPRLSAETTFAASAGLHGLHVSFWPES